MLLNSKGQKVDPTTLPRGRKEREAVLATLREVHEPERVRNRMFYIESRARYVA